MKLPPDPYSHVPSKLRVKLQSYVTIEAKDALMLVLPDRNLYTLLINHALRRAVEFIDTNKLGYNPADQQRLLTYITTGVDPLAASDGLRKHPTPRAARKTVSRPVSGREEGVGAASTEPAN